MIRVGITGVPGAGKTSLARSITSSCRRRTGLNKIELVSEYARRYISKHKSIEFMWEQHRIMQKQLEWENSIPQENTDIIITDSPVPLGFLYAMELQTNNPKDIMLYNDIFKAMSKLNENFPRYDLIFHLPPVIKPIDDGVRDSTYFDDEWRKKSDVKIQFLFEIFKPKSFIIIEENDIEDRRNKCIEYIMKEI